MTRQQAIELLVKVIDDNLAKLEMLKKENPRTTWEYKHWRTRWERIMDRIVYANDELVEIEHDENWVDSLFTDQN